MNTRNPRSHPGQAWLLYASIELPCASSAAQIPEEQLESLLSDTLYPLALSPDFTRKILASARDAAICIPDGQLYARLLVFTPAPHPAPGQTWGFFRTVKNEESQADPAGITQVGITRVIAFYLYVEGSTIQG